MICRECEKSYADDLNYCPNCGAPASASARDKHEQNNSRMSGVRPAKLKISIPEAFFDDEASESPEAVKAAKTPEVVKGPGADETKTPEVVKGPKADETKAPEVVKAPEADETKTPEVRANDAGERVAAPVEKAPEQETPEQVEVPTKTTKRLKPVKQVVEVEIKADKEAFLNLSADKKEESPAPKKLKPVPHPIPKAPIIESTEDEKPADHLRAEENPKIVEESVPDTVEPEESKLEKAKTFASAVIVMMIGFLANLWDDIVVFAGVAGREIAKYAKIFWRWLKHALIKLGAGIKALALQIGAFIHLKREEFSEKRAADQERKAQEAEARRLEEEKRAEEARLQFEADKARREAMVKQHAAGIFPDEDNSTISHVDSDTVQYSGLSSQINQRRVDSRPSVSDSYFEEYEEPKRLRRRAEVPSEPVYEEDFYEDDMDREEGEDNFFQAIYHWLLVRVRLRHFVILGLLILAVLAIPFLANLGSPTKHFEEALANKNFDQAYETYIKRYAGKDKLEDQSEEVFANYLNDLKQNAVSGGSTFSATNAAVNVMKDSKLYAGSFKTLMDKTLQELAVLQEADILYKSAYEKYNQSNYVAAIQDFNSVQEIAPAYRDTTNLLARAREQYRNTVVSEVTSLQSQKNFAEAINRIDRALELLGDDSILNNLKENTATLAKGAIYEQTSEEAERFFQAGNIQGAMNAIKEALKKEPENSSLLALKETYEVRAAEQIMNVADGLFLNDDKEGALEKIEDGLKIMPDNEMLKTAQTRYELELEKDVDAEGKPRPKKGVVLDAGGNKYNNKDVIVHNFKFTGDKSVVDRVNIVNEDKKENVNMTIALGEVKEYTQVYYQVYSVNHPQQALRYGTLLAQEGDNTNFTFKLDYSAKIYGSDLIVTLNYLDGSDINVIIKVEFK